LSVTHNLAGLGACDVAACDAAMSTMTLPAFMLATSAAVISFGAGRPGISAVVMMNVDNTAACSE